jgi:glycosyltransferase involved in cell wall biosynthesis
MKKILFLTNNWFGDYGGRRIVTSKIINNLSKVGYDITVANFESGSWRKNYDFQNKTHTRTYSIKKNSKIAPHLREISKTGQFDLIICSGAPHFDIMTILTIKTFRLFTGAKIVLFAHVHPLRSIKIFSLSIRDTVFNLGYYVLSHVAYRLFNKIITPSIGLKNFFINRLSVDGKKIATINNPIIKTKTSNIFLHKRTPSIIKKGLVLITVTRLNMFQKDFKTLFLALREINSKISCRLIILGDGKDKRKIIELSKRLGIANKIKLIGFKKDPINYISKADIFVFSSFFEGFANVLIEAMASGVPIVATDCDFGPKEIIKNEENGILVPVGDHKAMANAVKMLYESNKLREKFINNGFKRVRDYDEIRSFRMWNKFINNEI